MNKSTRLDAIVAAHAGREGPLLPILHDIQEEFGCIDEETKRYLASAMNLSRAEVHGVVSFYHDFKAEPAKRPVLKLCRAEACQARGCEALVAELSAAAKAKCEIETVYYLGLCSVGPKYLVPTWCPQKIPIARYHRIS